MRKTASPIKETATTGAYLTAPKVPSQFSISSRDVVYLNKKLQVGKTTASIKPSRLTSFKNIEHLET